MRSNRESGSEFAPHPDMYGGCGGVGLPYTASGWHALSTSANAPKAVSSTVLPFCVMVTWLAGRLRVRVSEP